MRIDAIELYYVTLPLKYPWKTAYGEDSEIHSVLVKAVSGENEGWGETTPFFAPTYSPETAGSVFFLLQQVFGPLLVGEEIETATELNERLAPFKGNPFAKAIHDLSMENGIPAWVGGMLESGIGAGICVELASLTNFTYPGDLFPSERFYAQDLTEPPLVLQPGCVFNVPDVPGTPYKPIQERIDKVTLRHAVVRNN